MASTSPAAPLDGADEVNALSEYPPMPQFSTYVSFYALNDDSWIIDGKLIITRHGNKPVGICAWSDGKDKFFSVSEAPERQPMAPPPQPDLPFPLVYDAGPHSVWRIGEAFLKLVEPEYPEVTKEHVTLNALHRMKLDMQLDFTLPTVLYHGQWDKRYCLITARVPGQTLNEAWRSMSETEKDDCVRRIVGIIKQLSSRQASYIGGIDGTHLSDYHISQNGSRQVPDFSPAHLLKNSKAMGMDCSESTFVFCHDDLAPGNILIDREDGSLSIIDWEAVGYVPKQWIKTKFHVSVGMILLSSDGTNQVNMWDYMLRMRKKLEEEGFPDVADSYNAWTAALWAELE